MYIPIKKPESKRTAFPQIITHKLVDKAHEIQEMMIRILHDNHKNRQGDPIVEKIHHSLRSF
jgi:hypothetical protein